MKIGQFNKKYHQGYYKPKHPDKYMGDLREIIYRSSWERKFMYWCDINSNIIKWGSEPFPIKYHNTMDKKQHKYWVDFWIKNQDDEKFLIEIKPYKQTLEPILKENKNGGYTTKKIEGYKREMKTWVTNICKWKAAREYANSLGWKFVILTEKQLNIK